MLRPIALVRASLQDTDEKGFYDNRVLIDATAYRIQHIGEAANKLSAALRERHPQLPSRLMVAMRNLLAHAYDHVDPSAVWNAATERLDEIEAMCRAELGQ